ncbi:serine/threonine-protein kinase [Gandjariella thermophila]|uniref:serine/threonine-protein kinase n=1 Tax=Gandjariella thermophila TaxID=1931992 RepID=UPI001CEF90E2|nr:serine/threonine-protein kinase [Gandjariella thermophila]
MTGQVDTVPAEPSEPPQIMLGGRYRLGAPLGAGGMAVVHRGLDTRLQRVVAIKVFRTDADGAGQRRFDEEARLLASLEHPGLVTVFDAGMQDGCAYLVMQLINGHTLREEIAHGPLPAVRVALLGARIADTLTHVHSRDVVHRDVKPSNILLDADGRPYLADFGISLLAGGNRLTSSNKLIGTVGYLAPEQVRGQTIGPAADVYALGLVLLECLTGRPEYVGGDVEAAVARLSRPPHVPDTVPEALGRLLRAMTDGRPELRPDAAGCAEALATALDALSRGTGYPAAPAGADVPTRPVDRYPARPVRDATRTLPADMVPVEGTEPAAEFGRSHALLPRSRAARATLAVLAAGLLGGLGAVVLSGSGSPAPPAANQSAPPDTGQPAQPSTMPPPPVTSAPSPVVDQHPANPGGKRHGGHGKRGG